MDRTMQVTFTPDHIRSAARHYWLGQTSPIRLAFIAIVTVGYIAYIALSDDRGWMVGAYGALILLLWLTVAAVYIVTVNRGLAKFRGMGEPVATFHFTERCIGTSSGLGTAEVPWRTIEALWTFEDVWLFFVARNSYFTLPVAGVDADIRNFVIERVSAAGGKVR